jgi:hypothetical protein
MPFWGIVESKSPGFGRGFFIVAAAAVVARHSREGGHPVCSISRLNGLRPW